MKIGIVGNGFVGRATRIFAKNYHSDNGSDERFEILPDTVTTPAKPNSIRVNNDTHTATPHTSRRQLSVAPSQGGGTPLPFFKRFFYKPIEVYIYDIRPELCHPKGVTLEDLDRECDLLFFCLPTPLNHDGSCYTKILEDAIMRCSNPYKIIRSTIPVGFAAKHGCYFMPEFLTEARWENDFRTTKEWIVGIPRDCHASTEEFKIRISRLIKRSHKNGSIDSHVIAFCHTNEAEMLKLMKNCFLSAKVGLMNEFYHFSRATQTDFNDVITLAKRDERMGTTHFQVPGPDSRFGFGGTCFPKDTHSLYCQMTTHGVKSHIYPAVLTRNDTYDRPEREWSNDIWRTTIPLPTPQSKIIVVFTNGGVDSKYLNDAIRDNLSKNNVVIQVMRGNTLLTSTTNPNHLVKSWPVPGTPLFFPRVDECYYTPYQDISTSYETVRDVMCIIDLWNSHEDMILYVVKNHSDSMVVHNDDTDNESGTEGFDDDSNDGNIFRHYNHNYHNKNGVNYTSLIEDYYHKHFELSRRRLVVMF
jgi:UDPglucose 6-dehydrogenase